MVPTLEDVKKMKVQVSQLWFEHVILEFEFTTESGMVSEKKGLSLRS